MKRINRMGRLAELVKQKYKDRKVQQLCEALKYDELTIMDLFFICHSHVYYDSNVPYELICGQCEYRQMCIEYTGRTEQLTDKGNEDGVR